ncbi:MAG: glycosyltransferase family 1 protein [candidate division WOR-3 bacterium]
MIIDTLIVNRKVSGIGSYTINLLKHLKKYIHFKVLTHLPEIFGNNYDFILAPRILENNPILRHLYLQTIILKEPIFRTYHSISLFNKGLQIITIHDILPILFPQRYKEQYYFFNFLLKPFIKKIDFIFTVSKKSKEDIIKFFNVNEEKVKVFYPSYDEELFKPIENYEEVLNFKRKMKLDNYFLIVGAQFKHKNVEIAIKVMKFFKDFKLVIVGTRKPYENELKKLIHELNLEERIIIFDYLDAKNLKFLYSGSLLLLFPSKYEGFGIPVLEAMAMGVPVIGTKAVEEAGGDAIEYADFDDIDSWKFAIEKVLNKRESYIIKGFERIKNFSWDKTAYEISMFFKNNGIV